MITQGGVFGVLQASQLVFDGENYDFGGLKMRTLLVWQDLWEIVEEGWAMMKRWKSKDRTNKSWRRIEREMPKLYFFIQQSISKNIWRIIEVRSSKEA